MHSPNDVRVTRRRIEMNWRGLDDISFIEMNVSVTRLVLRGNRIPNLAPLQGTKVKLLEASWNPGLNPVHLLGNSTITHLYLSGIDITDISFLRGNATIRNLYLCHNGISDLSPLKCNQALRVLHLDHNLISDLSPLRESCIEKLGLSHNRIQDISPLNLECVKHIDMSFNNIQDISSLRGNESIKYLNLNANRLEGVDAIGSMQVETVWITGCGLTDISGIGHTTTIERAFLSANRITDISTLQHNTSIVELHIENNWIEDLSPLQRNNTLRVMFLGNNRIKDVRPIEHLIERLVDLSHNRIEDISSILREPNPNMRHFWVYDNPIPKAQLRHICNIQMLNQENYVSRHIPLRIMAIHFLRK